MRTTTRLLAAGTATLLTLTLAACGGSSSSGDGKEFTLWSMWSEGEADQKVMAQAIAEFTKATGIRVKVQWKGRNPTKALLPTLNTSNVPADLLDTNNTELVSALASTGNALDMTSVYATKVPGEDKTVGDLVSDAYKTVATPVGGTSPVMVPYQASSYAFFYDGKSHPELAAAAPANWDEFFTALDAEKAKGRRPIAQDGSLTGYNAYYLTYFTMAVAGDEGYVNAVKDKTGQTWLKPAYLEAAKLIEKLAKGGYFADGYTASKFPAQQQKWANGDADFIYGGTWLPRETLPYAKQGFDYRAFPFPAVGGRPAPPANVALVGFGIPAKAKNQEAAKQFISFFLQKKYQDQLAGTAKEIAIRPDVPAAPEVAEIKKLLDAGRIVKVRAGSDFSEYQTKVIFPVNDELIFGRITAAEFVQKLADETVTYWKNR